VLFGREDILLNNIAWVLRHFPVFAVFGSGHYKLQPIHVEDFAALAVEHGQSNTSRIIDAIGSETFSYRELVILLGDFIGASRPIMSVPPWLGYWAAVVVGFAVRDVLLTRATKSPPNGQSSSHQLAGTGDDEVERMGAGTCCGSGQALRK
jgi:nucleoside-diphosphate-sugar epimerase